MSRTVYEMTPHEREVSYGKAAADLIGEALALRAILPRLVLDEGYWCDTGPHYGQHRIELWGYVTPDQLVALRAANTPRAVGE